jgi:hypothetical protein
MWMEETVCRHITKTLKQQRIATPPIALRTSVSPDANLPEKVDMLSGMAERSCTANDRLSTISYMQVGDNREKIESESNEPPILVENGYTEANTNCKMV